MLKKLRFFGRVLTFSGKRYVADQLGHRAVVLTYYTLFSIVPLAALLFGIAKGFSLETQLQDAIYSRFANHRELLEWVCQFAETTLRQASGSIVAGVGVIALFFTVTSLITNIEKSFNAVWGLPPRKNLWRKYSDYISLVLLTPIMLVAVSSLGVVLRSKLLKLGDALPGLSVGAQVADFAAGVAPVLIAILLFTAIYVFVPNTKVRFGGALAAGIFAGICYQLLQDGFLFLQRSVFSYNRIYGSFAALPLFLVWLNWSWQIILFGAEISFVRQHIDSGIFDVDELQLMSPKLRREHQLAILYKVFSEFERGAGVIPVKDISNLLKLPEIVLRNEISELVEQKILCRAVAPDGSAGLLPGVPPGKYTVMDFLRQIHGGGDCTNPEFARFDRLFANMEKEVSVCDLNVNIHQVK